MVRGRGCVRVRAGIVDGRSAEHGHRSGIVYGSMLAGLGVVFLLAQLDLLDIERWWRWWPLLGAAWGLSRILAWTSADDVGSGVTWVLLAVWFLASDFGWFDLDWATSWPLVLVAFGAGMVTTALLRSQFVRGASDSETSENSHA